MSKAIQKINAAVQRLREELAAEIEESGITPVSYSNYDPNNMQRLLCSEVSVDGLGRCIKNRFGSTEAESE